MTRTVKPGLRESLIAYVSSYTAQHHRPPVMAEIADGLGLSATRIYRLVVELESGGRLESLWVSGRRSPRSLRVVVRAE